MATDLTDLLPDDWRRAMAPFLDRDSATALSAFVDREYAEQQVFPPLDDLFAAFRLCPPDRARVLILGPGSRTTRPGRRTG